MCEPTRIRSGLLAACVLCFVTVSVAHPPYLANPRTPLGSADIPQYGYFGRNVVLDGETALVGAVGPPAAVYVYEFDGVDWVERAVLSAGDAATNRFGVGMALEGDTALIGAPEQSVNGVVQGVVYEFVREGGAWSLRDTLIAADGVEGDQFGLGVALEASRAVIGAPWADDEAGTAYVFERMQEGWTQVELPQVVVGNLGSPVAIEGDLIVVSAWDANHYQGAVVLYQLGDAGWEFLQSLTASATNAFGWSLALEGDTLVIGAPDSGYDEYAEGAVYVFERIPSGYWVQGATLEIDDPEDFTFLGETLSMDGGTIALGVYNKEATYLFTKSDGVWAQVAKIEPQEATLGYAGVVALRGDQLLVGSALDDYMGNVRRGRVHPYRVGPDCNLNAAYDADEIAAGTSPDCDANGVPDECDVECNGNAIPDACDLLAGSSADCNANSVPDECDLANAVSEDCNGNSRPDECDPQYFATSGVLSPVGWLTPQVHVFFVDSFAACEAELTLRMKGNLQGAERFVTVAVDGVPVGTLFETTGVNCPGTPNEGSFALAPSVLNAAAEDGFVVVSVLPSPAVDSFFCGPIATTLEIDLRYVIETACPSASVECDRADIFPLNGDCVVDLSDVGALLAGWTGAGGGSSCGADRAQGDIFPPGGDGCVDLGDLGQMLVDYGADCR